MSNSEFIKVYGKREFYDMCDYVYQELSLAKARRQLICRFKINNSKKRVKFINKDKEFSLEFATIWNIGCMNLQQYIENKNKEREKTR